VAVAGCGKHAGADEASPRRVVTVETVVVDVIEQPLPGVTVVTEFEATEVRDVSGATPVPPESEEP
jgi:hypothetical protein